MPTATFTLTASGSPAPSRVTAIPTTCWANASATEKSTAIASNFPFCRRARVADLMKGYANKNAVVGAIGTRGGSDLVAMTSNQARLALDIAASYGRALSMQRVQELVGVVTAGVGYRAVARELLGLVPGLGPVLKAGIGYAGTVATGRAVQTRFEHADVKGLKGLVDSVSARFKRAEKPTRAEIVPASGRGHRP